MKRGQVSVELIIMVSIALFLLMGFITIEFIQTKDIIETRKRIGAEDIAVKIKTEISLASRIEPTYERIFELPQSIDGHDYMVRIGTREIAVIIKDSAGNEVSSYPKIVPTYIHPSSQNQDLFSNPNTLKKIKISKLDNSGIILAEEP